MFGFNQIEHKSFNKNFLKTVIFHLTYEKNILFQEKKEAIKELFKEQFPRQNITTSAGVQITFDKTQTPLLQKIKEDDGLELKTEDGQKVLNISSTVFSLTVSGKVYKNYKTLKKDIVKLDKYLDLCEISIINRLAIRKINIVEYRSEDKTGDALNLLINPDLIGNLNHFPNRDKIINNIQTLNYRNEDNYLNIKYGLNVPFADREIGQVIIDIDLFMQTKIKSIHISSKADEINEEIFNIFNWVISENTIKFLNE